MFGLSMNSCAVSSINNYDEALRFYESCPTKRGMVYGDTRRIRGKEGSKAMGVRLTAKSVAFFYHSTDVVVWHSDGRCDIDLNYDSKSTAAFANVFLPRVVSVVNSCRGILVGSWEHGRVYPGQGHRTLLPDGTMVPSEKVFVRDVVNRKKARKLLKSVGYYEYLDWWKLMHPMVKDSLTINVEVPSAWEVFELLKSPETYHQLMQTYLGHPDNLRALLYADIGKFEGGIYDRQYEPHLPAKADINKWTIGRRDE